MNILASLTDVVIARSFDPLTMHRGLEYASDGRVSTPHVAELTRDSVLATAQVAGSRRNAYVVHLEAESAGGEIWISSVCSCPVQVDCKHGAALALTLGGPFVRPEGERTPWDGLLRGLIDDLAEPPPEGDRPGLALEIALDAPDRRRSHYVSRAGPPPIRVRPLRMGARGKWVKGGAGWRDLSSASALRDYPRTQLDALLDLHAALQTSHAYWYPGMHPSLADFGDRVVALLQRAAAAGVCLAPVRPLTGIELIDGALGLTTDLTRQDDGTHLRIGITHEGRLWSGDEVIPLGDPAHTVGLLDGGLLRIGRVRRPLTARVLRLLDGSAIEVPPDAGTALADRLAPLSRLVTLGSSDGSVDLPEPVRPVLELTVSWRSSVTAALRWEWCYATRRCAPGSADRLDGLRDVTAEQIILDRVPEGLVERSELAGGDALAFAVHDLPALRELEDVEVVEEQRPDFREADEAPEFRFEVREEPSERGTDWLDLEVIITVDGESVPLPEALAALTLGEEYLVLPSGLYLRTDRPEFDRLRDVVRSAAELREREGDRVSVGKHDLGVWAELAELGIVDAQAAEWVRRAQALRDLTDLPRPEPAGLATELRSYQRDGFHWLAFLWEHQLGGILADDMGLGKTLQVLALVQHAVASGSRSPFLVVAPTSVVSAWKSEAARHSPGLRIRTISRRADDVAAVAEEADLVVTTYTMLRLEQDSFAAVSWGGLVLDEAQQVKNHQSKTYAAVRRLEAPFRLAVTGTPFENRLMELWALLSITTPGLYPWPKSFTEHVVKPVEKAGDQAALRRFRQRIRPFLLRRTKELVAADLPPKQEQVVEVTLGPRHRKLYDTHLARERQRILGLVDDFDRNRVAIFSALTKLRQLALDPALVDPAHDRVGSAKLDLLVEHLAEITAEGHRALVFSQFTSFLGRVAARLADEHIVTSYLDGKTRDRGSVIEDFQSGESDVFLISLKAGGVGLTLTEADYVFVLDPWWNPAAEAQAVDRAHRIGQQRPVHVYRLIAEDTIEEKVVALKTRKAELFAQVVDGDGAAVSGITADDIRALFDE